MRITPERLNRTGKLLSAIYVGVLIAFALRYLWASLFRIWFYNADEYVFAFEVIRFVQLDFRQHFFDMPGTPLMFLASALWALYYGASCAVGAFSLHRGIAAFTFERLPAVFVLLRGITLFFYCVSLVLLFRLAARLMNRPAAWVATLILAMSPLYVSMSGFVRVESLSLCFMLAGFLVLVRALDRRPGNAAPTRPRWWDSVDAMLLAGVLVGLSMATRMHALTAALPAMTLLIVLAPQATQPVEYPRWVKIAALLAAVALGAGWLLTIAGRSTLSAWPHAYHGIRVAIVGTLGALALGAALYAIPRTRLLLVRIISPDLIRVLMGIVAGFLLGTPTIVRQYVYFLMSVNFYSTYTDVDRVGWPFWKNVQWYVRLYFHQIAPDRIVLVLLVAGAVCIVVRRDRRLLPFLAAAILFFVSKPLAMIAAPHHVVPWLPFYALVCSYPVGLMVDLGSLRGRYGLAAASAGFVAVFAALAFGITRGPETITRDPGTDIRLANVERASDWITEHTEPNATIAVGYYCFNPGVFFVWLRGQGVAVPPSAVDSRTYVIWWYSSQSLLNRTGYVCMTNTDIDLAAKTDQLKPGEGVRPRTDPRFQLVQAFGDGPNQVNLFRFDLRSDEPRKLRRDNAPEAVGSIRVVAATYGENCHATHGNSTAGVALACDGKTFCEYKVDVLMLGDPAPGCPKDFVAEWTCGDSPTVNRAESEQAGNGEAGYGSIATLTCKEDLK